MKNILIINFYIESNFNKIIIRIINLHLQLRQYPIDFIVNFIIVYLAIVIIIIDLLIFFVFVKIIFVFTFF